ncbi:HK97 family phage prohead protease [Mesorhizobium sp. LNJC405B00]|uniref:HK97 family phage prohead protease n=1 Tax=Mesorhizobium sp. LNJC405B00 TaxID=1287281 RepID=UPI0003CF7AC4|nr:HK97 family phage prohead protease [Mesorhizobium sp. LNJC405B00]ESX86953.1 primosomal replication protein N [Mesorhizobium sp. LNJC405B00]
MRETVDILELRLSPPADDGTVEGIAVKFDTLDSYRTTFDRRAFASVAKRLPMLWSHDPAQVVGSWSSITVADDGLRVKGRLNLEVERAREVRAMLTQGDIDGISIGFETVTSESRAGGVRHITKAIIHEISLVAIAAVPGAKVTDIRHGRESAAAAFVTAINAATRAFAEGKSK